MKFTKKQIRQILLNEAAGYAKGRHGMVKSWITCEPGYVKEKIGAGPTYKCVRSQESIEQEEEEKAAAAASGEEETKATAARAKRPHFSATTSAELSNKAKQHCVGSGPAKYAKNWAKSIGLSSDGRTQYRCIRGTKTEKALSSQTDPSPTGGATAATPEKFGCTGLSDGQPIVFPDGYECKAADSWGKCKQGKCVVEIPTFSATAPPSGTPGGEKKKKGKKKPRRGRRAAPKRRGGRIWAKGPKVGKIQQLLLKAFRGVALQEVKKLNEIKASQILGSRRPDRKLGPTTLKSLQMIPVLAKLVARPGDLLVPGVVQSILNTLQKCAKTGWPKNCKPSGAASVQAVQGTQAVRGTAGRGGAYTVPGKPAAAAGPKGALDRPMTAAEKAQLAATPASSGLDVGKVLAPQATATPASKKAAYDACYKKCVKKLPGYKCQDDEHCGKLKESKSPLKPIRIKHFDDRNKKLFEYLIGKTAKND